MKDQYKIEIVGEYIHITVDGFKGQYQLKLGDEGLSLDAIINNEMVEIMHCMNADILDTDD